MPPPATSMSSREFNQGTGSAKKAACRGPVYITDRGRPAFVLMSYDHYRQLLDDQPSLVDLLSLTPGIGDIEFEIPRFDDTGEPAVYD